MRVRKKFTLLLWNRSQLFSLLTWILLNFNLSLIYIGQPVHFDRNSTLASPNEAAPWTGSTPCKRSLIDDTKLHMGLQEPQRSENWKEKSNCNMLWRWSMLEPQYFSTYFKGYCLKVIQSCFPHIVRVQNEFILKLWCLKLRNQIFLF